MNTFPQKKDVPCVWISSEVEVLQQQLPVDTYFAGHVFWKVFRGTRNVRCVDNQFKATELYLVETTTNQQNFAQSVMLNAFVVFILAINYIMVIFHSLILFYNYNSSNCSDKTIIK